MAEGQHIDNPGRPEGDDGRNMLLRMNKNHGYLRDWALPLISYTDGMNILDIGCGGGATIAALLTLAKDSHIDGVDYMQTSVDLATETNQAEIGRRVNIHVGDVTALPFEDSTYDLATAVETTYFWPDMNKAFREVYRVLKKGGVFAIINEGSDPKLHTDWPNPEGNITIYTADQLIEFLRAAGFSSTRIDHGEGDVILVRGMK